MNLERGEGYCVSDSSQGIGVLNLCIYFFSDVLKEFPTLRREVGGVNCSYFINDMGVWCFRPFSGNRGIEWWRVI